MLRVGKSVVYRTLGGFFRIVQFVIQGAIPIVGKTVSESLYVQKNKSAVQQIL